MSTPMYDVAIVGGGPAGLTAALFLARYHMSVLLADSGESRAALIPMTRNQPFWPDGISGVALLDRMWEHVSRYPVDCHRAHVRGLSKLPEGFEIELGEVAVQAKSVLLATGVVNRRPAIPDDDHATAVRCGLLRYCPICDGFEVTDRSVVVVGEGDRLFGEAKFLRSFTSSLAIGSQAQDLDLTQAQRDELARLGIEIMDGHVSEYLLAGDAIHLRVGGALRRFDTMYAALGTVIRSELAVKLGARVTKEGCLVVDDHQRTSVPRLYAAGDVVYGVDQIAYAVGQATLAATTLRNDAWERVPMVRGEGTCDPLPCYGGRRIDP
jgi:thioredoxin reductase (NADPH)